MLANPRILIVNDLDGVAEFVGEFFERVFPRVYGSEACIVVTATDGKTALRLLSEEGPFDVVITDGRMPGIDGIDLMHAIRGGKTESGKNGTSRNTFICLQTAWSKAEYDSRISEGDFDLIVAPEDNLLNRVATVLTSSLRGSRKVMRGK